MSEKIPNSPAFKEELQISSFNKHSFDLKLFELPSSNFVVREVPVDYIYKNEDKISTFPDRCTKGVKYSTSWRN